MQEINLKPIGVVHSPYKQKFAIPRQPNLVPAGKGTIELFSGYADLNCLREIDKFSHLWILFFFHATAERGWSPTVQPPRLGGQKKVGVFASRSPFRPNPLGLSVLKYIGHESVNGRTTIEVQGIDILDKTPIIDIKPYIPYADSINDARGGYANDPPRENILIDFTIEAEDQLLALKLTYPELRELIIQILCQDPRPAWRPKDTDKKQYGMVLYDLNIKWKKVKNGISVIAIRPIETDLLISD